MFRRSLAANKALTASLTKNARCYTNYDHIKYPVHTTAVVSIVGYFITMWFIFVRQGSLFTARSEYKKDYLRVWRRKLGTGYDWADAWGPQIENMYKDLPEAVEE